MSLNFSKYLNIYEKTVILPGSNQEVKIKPLNTNQIKKLLVYENETNPVVGEQILDDILKFCIIDSTFDIGDLFLQDRYFLFIEVRKFSKGSLHTFEYTCPNCKSQSIQKINLEELTLTKLVEESIVKEVKILNDVLTINMGFIKRKDQIDAYKTIKKNLSNTQKQIEMAIINMALSIQSIQAPDGIDEEIPLEKKIEFLENLPKFEFEKIKDWFSENDFGIDLTIRKKCPHCGYETFEAMPLTNFFQ